MRNPDQRKRALCAGVLAFAMLAPLVGCERAVHGLRSPFAVLLVTIDTVRADRLSAYGYARPTSPALTALAAEGVRFEHAYCTLPGTDASHTSMLTGLYPRSHGLRVNGAKVREPASVETLASRLAAAGYATAAITARVGLDPERRGIRGFAHTDAPGADRKWRRADEVLARARDWLETHGDRPWLLWLHLWEPHKPYRPSAGLRRRFLGRDFVPERRHTDPPRFVGRDRRVAPSDVAVSSALYDAELAGADIALGRALELARSHAAGRGGLLVIVAGDHGESLGERQQSGDAFGHGASLYEEAVHVPWVMAWPGRIPPQVVTTRVSLVDLAPTVIELAGAGGPLLADGRSLAGDLLSEREPRPGPIFLERTGTRYSDIEALASDEDAIIESPWKLITAPGGVRARLFNLAEDPRERVDLAASHPERLRSLLADLDAFHRTHPMQGRSRRETTPEAIREREALRSLGYLD